jgi:hypothetical protein
MEGVAWRTPLVLAVGAAAWTTRAHSVAASTRLLTAMGLAALVCVALGLRQHHVGRPLPDAAGPVEPVLLLGVGLGTLVMSDAVRSIVAMTSAVFVVTALVALVGYPVILTAVVRLVQGRRRGRSGDMVVEAGARLRWKGWRWRSRGPASGAASTIPPTSPPAPSWAWPRV